MSLPLGLLETSLGTCSFSDLREGSEVLPREEPSSNPDTPPEVSMLTADGCAAIGIEAELSDICCLSCLLSSRLAWSSLVFISEPCLFSPLWII